MLSHASSRRRVSRTPVGRRPAPLLRGRAGAHHRSVEIERLVAADLAPAGAVLDGALAELADRDAARRLWEKDPSLWKASPGEQGEIVDRLGWLELPLSTRDQVPGLRQLADEVRQAGTRHVVLGGMGGSSLAPEVFRLTFGSGPGYPTLHVLDSTDPGAVRAVDAAIDPARTLFLIASKSGGTLEVMAFLAHFWEAAGQQGSRFCAITDPGTSLEALARERGFRHVFANPPDVGGRYSALSLFGLVPAALAGLDLARLLERAAGERERCAPAAPPERNPGLWLGAYLGGLARSGRDKLTLLTSPAVASFGLWVEQLLAESTGKEGRGIIPVVGEPIGSPDVYGDDRCFAALRLDGDDNQALDRAVESLRGTHPVVVARLRDRYDLGAELYRWEVATAVAGALLGIHPFDQPNVQESKDNTSRVLQATQCSGRVPDPPEDARLDVGDADSVAGFLAQAGRGEYVAFQAYLTPSAEVEARLQAIRARTRAQLGVATTLGFGPRFLHSTGQLHKGGPASGVFLQLTYRPTQDLPVPGQPYTFGTLLAAQALGDLQSLAGRGLRVARVDLGTDVAAGLAHLAAAAAALPRRA